MDLPGLQSSALGITGAGLASDFLSPRSITFERESHLHDALEHLARRTGGKALLNALRDEALPFTAGDADSYYWLGFAPRRTGGYREWQIELEVTRPGLKVRTRQSFTDLSHEREIGMAVESALLFGNPPSQRPLVARVAKAEKAGWRKVRAPLAVEIPVDAVTLLADGDRYVAHLELRVATLGRDGSLYEGSTIPLTLTVPSKGEVRDLVYETHLELRPKTEKLVVALYDNASGSILMSSLDVEL